MAGIFMVYNYIISFICSFFN